MTEYANKGIAFDRNKIRDIGEIDVTFRIISIYDIGTDQILTRFDLLFDDPKNHQGGRNFKSGTQFNASMFTTAVPVLEVPANGIIGGVAFNASKKNLAEALLKLVRTLEEFPNIG